VLPNVAWELEDAPCDLEAESDSDGLGEEAPEKDIDIDEHAEE